MILLCQDWRDVSERYASWHFSEKRFKLLRCEWWILGHLIRNSRPNYLSLKICDSFGKCGAPVLPCVRAVGGGGSSAPVWGLGRDFVPLRGASVATRPPCTTGCVSKHTVVICHLIDTDSACSRRPSASKSTPFLHHRGRLQHHSQCELGCATVRSADCRVWGRLEPAECFQQAVVNCVKG